MQRVLILGCSGSGKSTLARRLGEVTGLPVIHLDQHYWQPGWVPPVTAAWHARVAELAASPRWIMDGNYTATLPGRIAVADTFVCLDLPTWRCMVRMLGRTMIGLGRVRRDAAPGCRDHISWELIDYVRTYRRMRRPAVLASLSGFPGRRVLLRDQAEISRFIESARS